MPSRHPTLLLADLGRWPADCTGLGLFGYPAAHSLSPVIHNAALSALVGQEPAFGSWRYAKFEVAPGELGEALRLAHARGFRGLNLTSPHKEAVLAHVESADDFTRQASAANTLVRTSTGWHATNTDGGGMIDSLQADLGIVLRSRDVILLGAGGAARAAALQCVREGAHSLWIGNRGRERLDALLAHLAPLARDADLHGFTFERMDTALPAGAVLINATSAGLAKEGAAPVDLRKLPRPAVVFEMTYNPPVTALLRAAEELGLPRVNGLGMLVHQGARALSLWTGRPIDAGVMRAALRGEGIG